MRFPFSDFAWPVLVVSGEVAIALIALPIGVLMDLFLGALVNHSLGRLIIFGMLGAYDDSSGTLIPAGRVPLDISVVKCTLVLHSGTSGRVIVYEDFGSGRVIVNEDFGSGWVIHIFKGCSSADDSSPQIGVLARFCARRLP